MRPSCLPVYLVVLFILLYSVEGIRLEKGFKSSGNTKLHVSMQEEALVINKNGVMGLVIFCKEGLCTGNGRKLLTATAATNNTPASSSTSKSEDSGDNKANPTSRVKSVNQEKVPTSSQQQDQYADIMEIAEMDYSPAKRKSPIHN